MTDIDNKLSIGTSDIILNVGCGTGIVEEGLKVDFLVSIDFARSMLEHRSIKNGTQSDATYLPFRDEVFDKICVYSVIQYVSKTALSRMIKELSRCLKKGGRCLIGDIEPESSQFRTKVRRSLGHIVLQKHFEYHSLKWICGEFKKLGVDSIVLDQSSALPFAKSRKDILLTRIAN
ncbi:MAG: methyltransferase domain-containing protein [Nitrososphaerales archaeon]